MEPFSLTDLCVRTVKYLSNAVSSIWKSKADALVFKVSNQNSFFIGTIPRQCAVIWKYRWSQNLRVQNFGFTFFLWYHSVETIVVTGLVSHVFHIPKVDITVTFHIFDPMKFLASLTPNGLSDKIQAFLEETFAGHEAENFFAPEFLHFLANAFFSSNRAFNQFGVGITEISPAASQ